MKLFARKPRLRPLPAHVGRLTVNDHTQDPTEAAVRLVLSIASRLANPESGLKFESAKCDEVGIVDARWYCKNGAIVITVCLVDSKKIRVHPYDDTSSDDDTVLARTSHLIHIIDECSASGDVSVAWEPEAKERSRTLGLTSP